jgi:hypothetical protein
LISFGGVCTFPPCFIQEGCLSGLRSALGKRVYA